MEAFQLLDVQYRTPEGNTSGSVTTILGFLHPQEKVAFDFNFQPKTKLSLFFQGFCSTETRRGGCNLGRFASFHVGCALLGGSLWTLCHQWGFCCEIDRWHRCEAWFCWMREDVGKTVEPSPFWRMQLKKRYCTSNFKTKNPPKSVAVATISCSLYVFLNIMKP